MTSLPPPSRSFTGALPADNSLWERLRGAIPRPGSLGQRAARSAGWNLIQVFGQNLMRLGSNLIMTRLLVPDAFALVALVFILICAVTLATDIGIRQSIVREPDGDTAVFLRTAWVLKILHGLAIAAMLGLAALLIWQTAPLWAPPSTVYSDPRLPGLLAFGALVPVLVGLHSTNRELAERRLAYRPLALLELAAQGISILCMLLFAWVSPTVWALMVGALAAYIVTTVGSHLVLPGPRMRWQLDRQIVWRIWNFGKWLIGSSLFTFIARNADKLIFGILLNITTMGLLTIAYTWISAGQMLIQQLLSKVAYPALSEVKRDPAQDMSAALVRVQRLVDLMCLMGCAGAALLGPWFVQTLYSEPYHLAGNLVVLLGLGFLCLRFEVLHNLMLILGDSRGMMWLWVQRAGFLVLGLPLVYTQAGLTAALTLTALNPLISMPFVLRRLRGKISQQILWENVVWMLAILGAGGVMAIWVPLP